MPSAGTLRHRVTIQRLTRTEDELGGYTEAWNTVTTVWARVEPLTGQERNTAQQVDQRQSHKVTMRYRPGLTAADRLMFLERRAVDAVMTSGSAVLSSVSAVFRASDKSRAVVVSGAGAAGVALSTTVTTVTNTTTATLGANAGVTVSAANLFIARIFDVLAALNLGERDAEWQLLCAEVA